MNELMLLYLILVLIGIGFILMALPTMIARKRHGSKTT